MKTILLFGAVFLITNAIAQDPNLYYFCTEVVGTNDWLMEVFVRKNMSDMTGMFGVDLTSGSSMGLACDSTPVILIPFAINGLQEVTGDGTDSNPFSVTLTINKLTKIVTPACGSKVTLPAIVRANFQPTSSVSASWEVPHALTCDFAKQAITQTSTVLGVATITQRSVTVADLGDPFLLTVLNTNQQPVATITSEHVYLQAQFVSGPGIYSPLPNATGISPHSCKICDSKDCTGGLVTNLTDINGCPIGNHFVSTGLTGDGVLLKSSLLALSTVSNYSFIYFTCTEDYCTVDTGLAKCKNRCATLSGRKKRDVDFIDQLYEFNNQYYSQPMLYESANNEQKERRLDCSAGIGFGVVIAILSSIFIATVAIALAQCFRLFILLKQNPR